MFFAGALAHKKHQEEKTFDVTEQCEPQIAMCKSQVHQTMRTKHQQSACFQDAMNLCKTSDLHGDDLLHAITDCLRVKQDSVSPLCMEYLNTLPKLVVSPTLVVADDPTLVVADPTLVIADDPKLVPEPVIDPALIDKPLRKLDLQSAHDLPTPPPPHPAPSGEWHHDRHGRGLFWAEQIGHCLEEHQKEFPHDCQAAIADVVKNGGDWSFLAEDENDRWEFGHMIMRVAAFAFVVLMVVCVCRRCKRRCKQRGQCGGRCSHRANQFPGAVINNPFHEPLHRGSSVDSAQYTGTGRVQGIEIEEYI